MGGGEGGGTGRICAGGCSRPPPAHQEPERPHRGRIEQGRKKSSPGRDRCNNRAGGSPEGPRGNYGGGRGGAIPCPPRGSSQIPPVPPPRCGDTAPCAPERTWGHEDTAVMGTPRHAQGHRAHGGLFGVLRGLSSCPRCCFFFFSGVPAVLRGRAGGRGGDTPAVPHLSEMLGGRPKVPKVTSCPPTQQEDPKKKDPAKRHPLVKDAESRGSIWVPPVPPPSAAPGRAPRGTNKPRSVPAQRGIEGAAPA